MTEALKTTTEDWIGDIPESWNIERMRYSLKEINVKNSPVKTEQILSLVKDKGVMLYEEKGDVGNKAKEDISGYKVAFPDTLIVNSMNILIGSVGISKYKGCVSPVYYVFKENEKSDLRYINYIFNTREFQKELRKYANGILEIRLRVSATDIFNRKIPVPTKDEQTKIADFLDEKCAEIDKLSEDIQKQINILEDYKKAIIKKAVTKGLDRNAQFKKSQQDWIGDIPETWKLERMRYSLEEINVKNYPVKTEQILSLVKDKGVMLYEEKGDVGNKAKEDITGYKVAYPNTLVVNSMNILIGSVGISNYLGCVSPVYYVFKETKKSDLRFINYIFNTREFQKELRKYANGILEIRLRVSATDIFNRMIPVPPKEEQIRIADFLDKKCAEIDASIETKMKQLDNLTKYKKSIIYEYVTGKKRVA